ncbi:hypothetical protein DPMN_165378 [Dreissena polymorpha]|uniref:Uncharacterized protein n=1 Tax=Dreissena polymorpha TaxID=45954 RepID=A0A9D4EXI8_DREPO|nr:hypothetical protein DPMN_165378 [Dreissena polymorpha]
MEPNRNKPMDVGIRSENAFFETIVTGIQPSGEPWLHFEPDVSDEQHEEGKFNIATGHEDFTKDEVRLLEALKMIGIQP